MIHVDGSHLRGGQIQGDGVQLRTQRQPHIDLILGDGTGNAVHAQAGNLGPSLLLVNDNLQLVGLALGAGLGEDIQRLHIRGLLTAANPISATLELEVIIVANAELGHTRSDKIGIVSVVLPDSFASLDSSKFRAKGVLSAS